MQFRAARCLEPRSETFKNGKIEDASQRQVEGIVLLSESLREADRTVHHEIRPVPQQPHLVEIEFAVRDAPAHGEGVPQSVAAVGAGHLRVGDLEPRDFPVDRQRVGVGQIARESELGVHLPGHLLHFDVGQLPEVDDVEILDFALTLIGPPRTRADLRAPAECAGEEVPEPSQMNAAVRGLDGGRERADLPLVDLDILQLQRAID